MRMPDKQQIHKNAEKSRDPLISIGLPIRNGAHVMRRGIESILSQDYQNLELVLCDNASTDSTDEICREYAARDHRVRHYRNRSDIGQVPNFCKVFELSRGRYFKWMGADDWYASTYLRRCLDLLEQDDELVMVNCYDKQFDVKYNERYTCTHNVRVDSPYAALRFHRAVWHYKLHRWIKGHDLDPAYGVFRRDALEKTRLFRSILSTNIVLAAEASLLGKFRTIPEVLSFRRHPVRRRDIPEKKEKQELRARYDPKLPSRRSGKEWDQVEFCKALMDVVRAAPISRIAKYLCLCNIQAYFAASFTIIAIGRALAFFRLKSVSRSFLMGKEPIRQLPTRR